MVDLYHFAGLIFADAHTRAHYVLYNQSYFVVIGDHPQKQRKLDPSKFSRYTVLIPGWDKILSKMPPSHH